MTELYKNQEESHHDECQIQNVLVIAQDAGEVNTLIITFETPDENFDIESAAREAARDFCNTPEGRKIYRDHYGKFSWFDFYNSVPDEICMKYGFRRYRGYIRTLEVDYDDNLVEHEEEDCRSLTAIVRRGTA